MGYGLSSHTIIHVLKYSSGYPLRRYGLLAGAAGDCNHAL